jgi:plasmid stabilization system protein ParE
MIFRVEFTAEARHDADATLEYLLAHEAGEAGKRWFQALEEAIATLAEFPRRCGLAPENKLFSQEVRHLLYGRKPHVYRILFTVNSGTVYVLHIRHGRREPLKQ